MLQILYCLRAPAQNASMQALCRRSGLSCRAYQSSDAGRSVAAVLQPGIPQRNFKAAAGTAVPVLWQAPEFILMCGLPRKQMETFLDACAEAGISQDVLKAMVTPANITWTLYALLNQLQSEHNQLRNR